MYGTFFPVDLKAVLSTEDIIDLLVLAQTRRIFCGADTEAVDKCQMLG